MSDPHRYPLFDPGKLRFPVGILFCIFILLHTALSAQENPPDSITIEEQSWQLYSFGVRDYAFFDLYRCALYLDKKERGLNSIMNLSHPVGIRIEVLNSNLPDEVPDPWENAIKPEVSDKIYSRFKKQFFMLGDGDTLLFIYQPGQATVFYLNGEKIFSDPGPELFKALLEQWIGPDPVSEGLKASLLRN